MASPVELEKKPLTVIFISRRRAMTSSKKKVSATTKLTSAFSSVPFRPTGSSVFLPPSTINQAGLRCTTTPRTGDSCLSASAKIFSTWRAVTRGSAP